MQTLEEVNSGEDNGILKGISSTQMRYKILSGAAGEMTEKSPIQTKGVRPSGLISSFKFLYQKCWNGFGAQLYHKFINN